MSDDISSALYKHLTDGCGASVGEVLRSIEFELETQSLIQAAKAFGGNSIGASAYKDLEENVWRRLGIID